jgi:phytoene/squalene synthetase
MTKSYSHAPHITKAASKQTYYTVRFLADHERVEDAFRAYAYFRWVDDTLDGESGSERERTAFLERQKCLLEKCYHGQLTAGVTAEEKMLVELVSRDREQNSGLQIYLRNMMQVMDFDVKRRERLISQAELTEYTRWLASAVTEAMHYFIGHGGYSPRDETRYLAVSAAHITHMLRDTFDDVRAGYYNIPSEVLIANHIQPQDVDSKAYRAWVQGRVVLARKYFQAGREFLSRVVEPRCRLAGFAYAARFGWLLDTIEHEDFRIRPEYSERKSFGTGIRTGLLTLSSLIHCRVAEPLPQSVVTQSLRKS